MSCDGLLSAMARWRAVVRAGPLTPLGEPGRRNELTAGC